MLFMTIFNFEKTLFSFGHGYSASALENLLFENGWKIHGTTRSKEKAEEMSLRGVQRTRGRRREPALDRLFINNGCLW